MSMFSFDSYNQTEIPNIYLANPDGTPLYNLGTIFDRKFELRYNSLSKFTFTAPSQVDEITTDYYKHLEYRRLVCVENIGNFMITNIDIENDGMLETKKVTCQSLEVIMSYKKVSFFKGTYMFNSTKTTGSLNQYVTKNLFKDENDGLMNYIPGWTLDDTHMSGSYATVARTFDITDKTLYDFLVNDISQTFQCVFVFDSIAKTITPYPIESATTATDIFISFDNLMKSFTLKESTEELVTALTVVGGEGIYISNVNPIGGNTIYNFDYYKDNTETNWMSEELKTNIENWEAKIVTRQPEYADYMTAWRQGNDDKVALNVQLTNTNSHLAYCKTYRDAQLAAGEDTTMISGCIAVDNAAIAAISGSIAVKEEYIQQQVDQLTNIHNDLAITNTNNFTLVRQAELNNFIIGSTYTDTNFIKTDIMTEVEVEEWCEKLYNQAKNIILPKVSQPRYSLDIDSINFAFLKEFEVFTDALSLGCTITVELKENTSANLVVLGIDFNYDNPEDFKILLSNRLRLDDEGYQYEDLFSETVDAGITTKFNSPRWNLIADSYSKALAKGETFVTAPAVATANHIALFSGSVSVNSIKDEEALYISSASYVPYLIVGSDNAKYTYSTAYGYYNIVGRVLFFNISLAVSGSLTGTSGSVAIRMPPYLHLYPSPTSIRTNYYIACSNVTFTSGYTSLSGLINSNDNRMLLYQVGSGVARSQLTQTGISNSSTLDVSGFYFIN